MTHGWLSHEKNEWLQEIKDAFVRKFDFNVITVDWSEIAQNPAYPWSAFSTRYVGKKTAKLLDSIARTYQVDGKVMHLMGHSLGSHVMGYTALFSNQRIHRITGRCTYVCFRFDIFFLIFRLVGLNWPLSRLW